MKQGRKTYGRLAVFFLVLLLSTSVAYGEVPERINYQGYLTDNSGNPITTSVSVTFSIYTVPTGGTDIWTETHTITPVEGVYSVVLGTTTPLFLDYSEPIQYYLGVKVGADNEMTPRQELTSVGSSHTADTALDLNCTNCVSSSEVDTTAIQRRVTGSCSTGSSIRVINQDGTVSCEEDSTGSGTPSTTVTTLDGASVPGTASEYSRGDHKHAIGTGVITTTHILNSTITNADISAAAAISGTKLASDGTVMKSLVAGTNTSVVNNNNGSWTVNNTTGSSGWSLTGNAGTTPGTNFIGTTDNQALEVKVNSLRVMRFEPNITSPNVIGGYSGNYVTAGAYGATIGGGGEYDEAEGEDYRNKITDTYGTICGGLDNRAGDNIDTTLSAAFATVGGGWENIASKYASTVGGGTANTAGGSGSTVSGGSSNTITGSHATISGGSSNFATGDYATINGGRFNDAAGQYCSASGRRAKANHDGAFVWADSTDADFASTTVNEFAVRASGGTRFQTNKVVVKGTDAKFISDTTTVATGYTMQQGGVNKWTIGWNSGNGYLYFYDHIDPAGTRLVIQDDTGNVGIGEGSPSEKLVIGGNLRIQDSGNTKAYRFRTSGDALDFDFYKTNMYFSAYDSSNNQTVLMLLHNDRKNVGIGTTNPNELYKLEVKGASTENSYAGNFYNSFGGYSSFALLGGTARGVTAGGSDYAFFADYGGYGPFTGVHEVKLSEDCLDSLKPGMLVSVTGKTQKRTDEQGTLDLSSTMPTVTLSKKANDKAVFGVYIKENKLGTDHWYQSQDRERFGIVNALGEGRVLVTNTNGEIEAGDYITTSDIPGYGQRQDDDLLHSYTFGKAIETIDWDTVTEKIEHNGKTYKVYLIAVVYTSG